MAIVKCFYGKRIQHRFLSDVVNQIKDDGLELTDVAITGPPTGEQDSDLDNENYEILNTTGLHEGIAEEIEDFNIRNGEIERMNSDGEDNDVGPPTVQKQC